MSEHLNRDGESDAVLPFPAQAMKPTPLAEGRWSMKRKDGVVIDDDGYHFARFIGCPTKHEGSHRLFRGEPEEPRWACLGCDRKWTTYQVREWQMAKRREER